MPSTTPNLGLLKKDLTTDPNGTFNIKEMLSDNWDKIDSFAHSVFRAKTIITNSTDWNTLIENGTYGVVNTIDGANSPKSAYPTGVYTYGVLVVQNFKPCGIVQTYYPHEATRNSAVFIRTGWDSGVGTWHPWKRVITENYLSQMYLDEFKDSTDGSNKISVSGKDLLINSKRALVGFSTADGNILRVNYNSDFATGVQVDSKLSMMNDIVMNNYGAITYGGQDTFITLRNSSNNMHIKKTGGVISIDSDSVNFRSASGADRFKVTSTDIATQLPLLLNANNVQPLTIKTGTQNHGYIGLYVDKDNQDIRSAYIGFGSGSSRGFSINNEIAGNAMHLGGGGEISLTPKAGQMIHTWGDMLCHNHIYLDAKASERHVKFEYETGKYAGLFGNANAIGLFDWGNNRHVWNYKMPTDSFEINTATIVSTEASDILLKNAGDVRLTLEADSGDTDENNNPTIYLKQDAGQTQASLGLDSTNRFYLKTPFSDNNLYHLNSSGVYSKIWTEGNDGAGSGLVADKLHAFAPETIHRNNVSYIPVVAAGGTMEIGRYLDFHTTGSTADYDIRFDCESADVINISGANSPNGLEVEGYTVFNKGNYGKLVEINTSRNSLLTDTNMHLYSTNTVSIVYTIQPDSIVNHEIGTEIAITQYGAGSVTIALGAGVTIRNTKRTIKGIDKTIVLKKIKTNEWLLSGDSK